jgi:glutathione S-transferase
VQLFTNPASPFCRKVDVVLRETGLRDAATDAASLGHPTDAAKMPTAQNPLGKIPTLVLDDGTALYDSRVICRYLNDRAGAALYPADRLWDVLTLEATGDGISDAAVLMVYEVRSRPEEKRHAPWVEGQWAKIARALDMLESGTDRLGGPLDIGQIAVACALGYLDLRHADRDWRSGRAALARWHTAVSERPSLRDTVPAL